MTSFLDNIEAAFFALESFSLCPPDRARSRGLFSQKAKDWIRTPSNDGLWKLSPNMFFVLFSGELMLESFYWRKILDSDSEYDGKSVFWFFSC